jgi:hypothetical protein
VGEDGQQPALEVRYPTVRHRYERDGPWRHRLIGRRRSLKCLEVAPLCAVQHVPPTGAQLFADGIGRFEVALAPALDALGQQLFSL